MYGKCGYCGGNNYLIEYQYTETERIDICHHCFKVLQSTEKVNSSVAKKDAKKAADEIIEKESKRQKLRKAFGKIGEYD